MNTITLPRSEYLRLRAIEKMYKKSIGPHPRHSGKNDDFLQKWGGAFSTVKITASSDPRLIAITKKHVR